MSKKLFLLTAAAAVIAFSPLAMAQSGQLAQDQNGSTMQSAPDQGAMPAAPTQDQNGSDSSTDK
jgi:hypothetical protein